MAGTIVFYRCYCSTLFSELFEKLLLCEEVKRESALEYDNFVRQLPFSRVNNDIMLIIKQCDTISCHILQLRDTNCDRQSTGSSNFFDTISIELCLNKKKNGFFYGQNMIT